MLTEAELEQWDLMGAVTVQTPLTAELLQAARDGMLRHMPRREPKDGVGPTGRATNTNHVTEQEDSLVEVIQHPWFEAVARQCLRADSTYYNGSALAVSYPDNPHGKREPLSSGYSDGREQRFPGEHVDVQCACSRLYRIFPQQFALRPSNGFRLSWQTPWKNGTLRLDRYACRSSSGSRTPMLSARHYSSAPVLTV